MLITGSRLFRERLLPKLAAALLSSLFLFQTSATLAVPGPQQATKDGVIEMSSDAQVPSKDGVLITSDGKGLRFVYRYFKPKDPHFNYAYQWAVDTHLLADIPEISGLDGLFVLPRSLNYVTMECGAVNAFYSRKLGAVIFCYEMIDDLLKMGSALSKGASDPKALMVEFVRDNVRFIALHESGHALIDLLDLPAVGREEDSVDQLASVMLLTHAENNETKSDIARIFQLASVWFRVNSANVSPDARAFADEHSLDAQRYYNLLCMVYGVEPETNAGIVKRGMLPPERAERCKEESPKIYRSWARLLLPHFSPRFAPKDEGGANAAPARAQPTPRQAVRNPLEWDGKSNPFGN